MFVTWINWQGCFPLEIKSRMIGLICFFMMVLFLTPACHKEFYPNDQSKITLFLDAKSDWYNTGLRVKKGRTLVLECRGSWAVAPKKESQRWPDTGPEGHGKHPGERVHSKGNHKKELPGVPFGTLLGRIGPSVFSIGDRKEVVMPSSGRLYLVINDYPFYRHDNRGGLIITITAQ